MSDRPDRERRTLLTWLWRLPVIAAAAGLGTAAYQAYRVHFGKQEPDPEPAFDPLEAEPIAPLDQFAEVWEDVDFTVSGMPGIVLRLPQAVPGGISIDDVHLAAFSRICTHLGCTVSYRRDLEALAFGFNYRSNVPALACPCHLGVFLPSEAGKAVSGPPVEPLVRIKLQAKEDVLHAVGIERRA